MKRFLLDTHIFLWMLQRPERLSAQVRASVIDPANEIFFSAVVAWEIGVKRAEGKLVFEASPKQASESLGLAELAISALHCEVATGLAPHHRDPFDRLLVAQAEVEGLLLVTSDPLIVRYGIPVLRN